MIHALNMKMSTSQYYKIISVTYRYTNISFPECTINSCAPQPVRGTTLNVASKCRCNGAMRPKFSSIVGETNITLKELSSETIICL